MYMYVYLHETKELKHLDKNYCFLAIIRLNISLRCFSQRIKPLPVEQNTAARLIHIQTLFITHTNHGLLYYMRRTK